MAMMHCNNMHDKNRLAKYPKQQFANFPIKVMAVI